MNSVPSKQRLSRSKSSPHFFGLLNKKQRNSGGENRTFLAIAASIFQLSLQQLFFPMYAVNGGKNNKLEFEREFTIEERNLGGVLGFENQEKLGKETERQSVDLPFASEEELFRVSSSFIAPVALLRLAVMVQCSLCLWKS